MVEKNELQKSVSDTNVWLKRLKHWSTQKLMDEYISYNESIEHDGSLSHKDFAMRVMIAQLLKKRGWLIEARYNIRISFCRMDKKGNKVYS